MSSVADVVLGPSALAERPAMVLPDDMARSPVVHDDPHRRGPKKHRFTRTQEMLLRFIAGETVLNGGVRCTKRQLASLVGRNVKTVDRSIAQLRREGLLETEMGFAENGAQTCSVYRIAPGSATQLLENNGALVAPAHIDKRGEAPTENGRGGEDEPSPEER